MHDAIVIGGGLGGLTVAIELAGKGFSVIVIEKHAYPFHKVCGEYISNEVRPYLEHIGLDINKLGASTINKFQLTSIKGKSLHSPLQMGGFGISRYTLDYELYRIALNIGVQFELNASVEDTQRINDTFFVDTNTNKTFQAKVLIGSYGKRARVDKVIQRPIPKQQTSYLGIKYHISLDYPKDLISLHNFHGGYCGISAIEDNKFCLCYLSQTSNLKHKSGIKQMEEDILYKNPFLKEIFTNAEFLFKKPEVINEVVFVSKSQVHENIIMVGDSAGLITPLAGNGMSIAIRSGFFSAQLITEFLQGNINRTELEKLYISNWNSNFRNQLWRGRQLQKLFGKEKISELAITFLKNLPVLMPLVIRSTHGKVLEFDH
ncbi:NAD(P)/FAD-dependent oxidoreductase [Emticicia sp. C21]|uniref:NAD(P)/FAD-dependent oxidoreductase n=1 Tax=Emticicia sp. C21 TaxID=2302915 RepID=UPI000E34DD7A|nr:NAD(P)/FAD-dependent oxidoreductase [Emticicia sp. C21]RFS14741.1 NAD(P)/FAD-dependent oxidoreductase [Emticicia sp. C21]